MLVARATAESSVKPVRGDGVWTGKAAETPPCAPNMYVFRTGVIQSAGQLNGGHITKPRTYRRSLHVQVTRSSVAASSRRVTSGLGRRKTRRSAILRRGIDNRVGFPRRDAVELVVR
ncbi:hypothetical protein B296_00044455 [Ensete ventricosum]|uniref:Uncharacterized protein n=1 Tax=Ensete ventricosum TaxID=4639 RepID=A0A426XS67_ENSVE|nr:hypothetical protein B296_00044455 [Ensete ventricosum]